MNEYWTLLQTWWQEMPPHTQAAFHDAGVVLVALLGGYVLGGLVARKLRAKNFDAALRLPTSSPEPAEADHGITPTLLAGLLVQLTVWGVLAWWLARKNDRVELAQTIGLVLSRAWAVAAVLVAALGVSSLLARRLIECLHGISHAGPEPVPQRNGTATAPRLDVAGAAAAIVYVLVVLLTLLIAADVFDWPLTRSSALALWQLAQNLLVAGAALLVGCLGARWARDLVTADAAVSAERRAGQYTALGIVAATTVLAVAVLLSSAGVLLAVAAVAVLGLAVWALRDYLPEVAAGLQLRSHKVREVWFEGTPWHVTEVGFLSTQVGRAGTFYRVPNRSVLEALMRGAPAAEAVAH